MSKPKNEAEKAIAEVIDKVPYMLNANLLYSEFVGMTDIERVKEEDYVLRELMRGTSKHKIMNNLRAKYPEYSFTGNDFEKFLARNQEVVKAMGKEVSLSARRHLEARAQCSEVLAGVALYTQNLIQDFKAQGDNTNTVAAIRALNTTLENYMKVEGMIGTNQEGGKVLNIIQTVSDSKNRLKDKIHSANFRTISEDK